jgi:hypothetical protein
VSALVKGGDEQGGASAPGRSSPHVMARGTIQVFEFVARPAEPASSEEANRPDTAASFDLLSLLRLRYRTATSGAVAVAVIALHALALVPVLRSTKGSIVPPREFGAPVAIQAAIIDDRSASALSMRSQPRLPLRPIRVNLADLPDHSAADPGLAALYGRYMGQIHARIDRAWLRPREAIGAPMFRCKVELWQRRDGSVRSITLQRCNGTMQWQQSLVQGISAASPLPAPPNPAVFAHQLELHFEATAFVPEAEQQR